MDRGAAEWVHSHAEIDGPIELFHAEPWAIVYPAPIRGGCLWFKVCAEHQAFEVPLTAKLSSRWACVSEVVAYEPENRWLLMADAGVRFKELGNPPDLWLKLLPAYAELQIDEATRADEHLAGGVPDFRLLVLPRLYEAMVAADDLPVSDAERSALVSYAPRFANLCDELRSLSIADTVQHDDLHMNNVFAKGKELRILDWGDASIAHPYFSLFETFRFLVRFNGLARDDPWFSRLQDAYLEAWGDPDREAFELALRMGAVARAIAWFQQREALAEPDRRAFDDGFDEILRYAVRHCPR
jgi:hypothetical protein